MIFKAKYKKNINSKISAMKNLQSNYLPIFDARLGRFLVTRGSKSK